MLERNVLGQSEFLSEVILDLNQLDWSWNQVVPSGVAGVQQGSLPSGQHAAILRMGTENWNCCTRVRARES